MRAEFIFNKNIIYIKKYYPFLSKGDEIRFDEFSKDIFIVEKIQRYLYEEKYEYRDTAQVYLILKNKITD